MSQYTFIASRGLIPELDLTEIMRVMIKDIRHNANFPASLAHLSDETEIMYAKDEQALNGLRIFPCIHPPYDLKHYITIDYIYTLEGTFDAVRIQQFIDYLHSFVTPVEIWSIAFGQGRLPVQHQTIPRAALHCNDMNILNRRQSTHCLTVL
ncbi:hypothetical protein [Paenibacillus guangzhouensis]|uniref:hypothetical protein n=1 Tax=Paenibacillus guangzhouensis TaxID=1473112 RepID=UPI00126708DA|nr:hypothetical protein [Paenibacillus guangzhouensis]